MVEKKEERWADKLKKALLMHSAQKFENSEENSVNETKKLVLGYSEKLGS